MKQLPLGIALPKSATFDSFYADRNSQFVAAAKACAEQRKPEPVYLHGPTSCGKTHLLQAACNRAAAGGKQPFYLPLSTSESLTPDILANLESLDLIALDNLDAIAGIEAWEQALFGFYNAIIDAGSALLIAARSSPANLEIQLPDLRSRLSACTIYRLEELEDSEKIAALQRQAEQRGMGLNEEVGRYLLSHVRRDMGSLLNVLDQLDKASLVAQRRLTIPFIKEVLKP